MVLYWLVLVVVWVLAHCIWRFEVIGRENLEKVRDGRPFVIAPNHISMLDPVLIAIIVMDWRRLIVIAKQELFKNPLFGWFLRCMGAVAIDRGKGDTSTLDKVTEQCKNGKGLLIFPEGTRTKTGKLGPLKGGTFLIAGQAGADVLPCRLIYHTRDGRLHMFHRVRVCFGEPIPAEAFEIKDPSHKIAALRGMKHRLADALEALLEANKFDDTPRGN